MPEEHPVFNVETKAPDEAVEDQEFYFYCMSTMDVLCMVRAFESVDHLRCRRAVILSTQALSVAF